MDVQGWLAANGALSCRRKDREMSLPRIPIHFSLLGLLAFAACFCACSDESASSPTDAAPDSHDAGQDTRHDTGQDISSNDAGPKTVVGEVVELSLLPGDPGSSAFNHSTEPSIAAHGDHVVAAYINLGMDSTESFQATNLARRVAVAYSHDGGKTFSSALNPQIGDQTSDPVVRVNAAGDFFLSVVDPEPDVVLGKSTDHGESWQAIATVAGFDKEWLAISDDDGRVYLGAQRGYWVFDFDGTQLGHSSNSLEGLYNGGYADASGVYFAAGGGRAHDLLVVHWDGSGEPATVGASLSMGISEDWNNVAASIGSRPDGGHWIIRSVESGNFRQVLLRERDVAVSEGSDMPLTPNDRNAFMPAAATDDLGRLYVVWYETDASAGVLKLTRSKGLDWSKGFDEPLILDSNACPGDYWYPSSKPEVDDRRLREYIDISVSGARAHAIWTHAPEAPSRVRTVAVQFAD